MTKKQIIPFLFTAIILVSFKQATAKKNNSAGPKTKVPKNVIIMIGDGMGFNQVEAADFYQYGKKGAQVYENFPVKYAVSTYPAKVGSYPSKLQWAAGYNPGEYWKNFKYALDNSTESAAAATEIATGRKTYNNSIGMDLDYKPLVNLTDFAGSLGKASGVVTTVSFPHATPAAFVAHNVTRNNYPQIAKEMLLESKLDVIMGCGNPMYDNNGSLLEKAKSYEFVGDSLTWESLKKSATAFNDSGRTRIIKDIDGDGKPDAWKLIQERADFVKYMSGKTPKRLLGVPKAINTLQEARKGDGNAAAFTVPFNNDVPTLQEMALAAINVLDNNPKGFFLMIEGGAIDGANHANQPGRLIEEMTDFNKAIEGVVSWVEKNSSWDETLLIITADHESGYLWGPNSGDPGTFNPIVNNGKGNMPGMAFYSKGHSNGLVPVFAKGAGSDLFNIFADEADPVRGRFISNTEIPQAVFLLWGRRL